jgi:DNA ligase-1
VWVERKYDGIRLMLHKSTDARGSTLCGAYTRNRHDWLELVPGLDQTLRLLPCRNAILDGELYGTVLDLDGSRPASVYEVYAQMQGEKGARPVNLKFAAFDLIYLDGVDLTKLPLSERRRRLSLLLAPLQAMPAPVTVSMSDGQLASTKDDVNRLYGHFRSQGYEGVIAKDPDGPYLLGQRDQSWLKRKPEITLDVALIGAVLAVTEKQRAGRFGSYVIAAKTPEGGWQDIGDVAGVDQERDLQIQSEIMRSGLITGRRIERQSSSGVRPGFELIPSIVVTIRFEGVTRETGTGKLSLRDPKLVVIRSDKNASEADTTKTIEEIYLRSRVG